ncbi:MAG: TrbG/VirB9 family P-type conjugative transfer protein [Treponema sp.]|nr:TrbG/VirB9 family P-type conjugative transfer protein [Treponema sp.]
MKKFLLFFSLSFLLFSCATTVDLEKDFFQEDLNDEDLQSDSYYQSDEYTGSFIIQDKYLEADEDANIVIVERPVYYPESKASKMDKGTTTGKDAAVQSLKAAIQKPEQYKSGTFYYSYNDNWVYEIYAQPLHLTDIALEPGEIVTANPLLSEDASVWELTAGVATDPSTGLDVQHLFVKPAYSKLDSTLVVITNKRVYHFNLKSYSDTYMAMVKFTYPNTNNVWATSKSKVNEKSNYIKTSNSEFLSFDYITKYSKSKKPNFTPTLVYDDGSFTYIQVDEIVLQSKLPALFSEKNEIINYEVKDNVFVIPRLITKVTLRIGKEKVVIEKKVSK